MDAADRLESLRGELVRSFAHDLKTPLNGVLGLGELVALSSTDPAVRRYGELIRESGARLQHLLQALLDLAQLSPRVPPDPRACDLAELLHAVAACHTSTLQRGGVELTVRAEPGLPRRLFLDRPRLAFLLHMLVRDATARATPPAELALCAQPQGGGVGIVVRRADGVATAGTTPASAGATARTATWDAAVAERLLAELGGRQLAGGGADPLVWLPAPE